MLPECSGENMIDENGIYICKWCGSVADVFGDAIICPFDGVLNKWEYVDADEQSAMDEIEKYLREGKYELL